MNNKKDFDLEKSSRGKRGRSFFLKSAECVAKNLIGDYLVLKRGRQVQAGLITETESYLGINDDASHSFLGKKTVRNEILYRRGGLIYVYLIYGLYWCFNVVTSVESNPQSVFIRSLEPVKGLELMKKRRKGRVKNLTNGPCRWTMAFGINKSFLGKDIALSDEIFILEKRKKNIEIIEKPRVGIDYAVISKDLPLRYCMKK